MTESPNPQPSNESSPRRRFGRVKAAIGILLLTGVGGGIGWGWWFVDRELVPLVTRELTKLLNRPVNVGQIQSISLGSIRAGKSTIPATASDPDSVEIDGVKVRFNLLKFLWSRKLDLDVTLVEPTVYIERDLDGAWVSTEIAEAGEEPGLIQVALNRIALEKGTVTVSDPLVDLRQAELEVARQEAEAAEKAEAEAAPEKTDDAEETEEEVLELPVISAPPSETTFKRVNGSVDFLDDSDRIKFETTAYPKTGRARVRGEYLVSKEDLKLNVSGQNLPAGEASIFVDLPVAIATGKINTNLNVELDLDRSEIPPNLEGNLRFEEIDAQIDNVPQPPIQGDGQLRFSGSSILIEDTQANYGLLPVFIPQGLINLTQGYEIPIQVQPTDLAQYLTTLELESPVEISGEAEAVLKVVGPIETPVLVGEAKTTDVTTIDRIPFGEVGAQFALATADGLLEILQIQAIPDVGGEIQGAVVVQLPTAENPDPSQNLPTSDGPETSPPETSPQETPQSSQEDGSPLPQLENLQNPEPEAAEDATPDTNVTLDSLFSPEPTKPASENPKSENPDPQTTPNLNIEEFEVDEDSPLAPFVGDEAPTEAVTEIPSDTPLDASETAENPDTAEDETSEDPQPLIRGEFLALDVPGVAIAELYEVIPPPGIEIGSVSARTIVAGPADNLQTRVQWEALNATYPAKGEIQILPAGLLFQNTLVQVGDSIVQGGGALVGDRWEALIQLDKTPIDALLPPEQTQGFDFGTATGPIQLAGTVETFDLASIEGVGQLDVTVGGGNVQAVGRLSQGQWAAQLGLADTPITPFLPPETPQGLDLGPATGRIELTGSIDSFDLASIQGGGQLGLTVNGGNVVAAGGLAQGQWEAILELVDTPITPFLPPETTAALNLGPATGQMKLAGSLDATDLGSIEALGQLNLSAAGGNAAIGGTLRRGQWDAVIEAEQIPIANLAPDLTGDVGVVGGNMTLSGPDLSFDPNAIAGRGTLLWGLGAGGAQADVILDKGRWQADIPRFGLPLEPFLAFLPAEVAGNVPSALLGDGKNQAFASGTGTLGGSVNSLMAADWQNFEGNGDVIVGLNGGGTRGDVTLADGRWQVSLAELQVPLAPFLPLLPKEVSAYVSPELSIGPLMAGGKEPLLISGSVYGLRPESLVADGAIGFQFDGGNSAFVLDGEFDRGTWNALTTLEGLDLNTLFPPDVVSSLSGGAATADVRGQLDGQLSWVGTLRDFTPEAIASALQPESIAEGEFILRQFEVNQTAFDSVILGEIDRTTKGLRLEATAADGTIVGQPDSLTLEFGNTFLPTLLETQFDVAAQTLVDVGDEGRSRGTLLDEETYAVSARVERKGSVIDADVSNVPLSLFGLNLPSAPPSPAAKPVDGKPSPEDFSDSVENAPIPGLPIAGLISGATQFNLATQTGNGNVRIDRPSIGLTRADSFVSQFDYTGDSLALNDTVLNKGISEYRLAGRVDFNPKDPQFFGSVEIASGQIQDILAALGWFDIQALARGLEPPEYTPAAELELPSVGIPDAPLLDQLRRFSEIQALLEQQRVARKAADPLPGLYELEGLFDGKLDIVGSMNTGVNADFALEGGEWVWGKLEDSQGNLQPRYRANQLVAVGSLEDGLWNFDRLDVRANLGQETETQLEFAGLIGGKQQSAQFNLVNLPLEFIEQFTEFPLGIQMSGNLNTSAALSGSFANPQARGELSITEGIFNGEPLASSRGGFSYSDARLNFSSQLSIQGPDPIALRGSIPYEFPGSTATPESEEFNLEVNVENEGLRVLNLFNDQAIWESGQGTVDVDIAGKRIEGVGYLPESTIGFIELENAVFSSPSLPEPLTNVTGILRLEDDTIAIEESLTGQFDRGQVVATGSYSLVSPVLPEGQTPLTVGLEGVELELKGLYRGGIDGEIVVGGYFLVPQIGGEITLSDGQVLLQEQPAATEEPEIDLSDPFAPVVLYDNLNLVLARNTQILTPPVLNFLADGELTITGTIEDPRAAGTIFLRQGLVNLFTTQFTLARNYKNTATFLPERGLDPNLSVLMRASVQEATRDRFPAKPTDVEALAEIQESAIERGTVQTVRIEAKVTGPASELANNLELTSRPARTETEIVALMGGGFVNTLGRGDTTLAIANLASSVLLTQIQAAVGQTLGLRDFRLFPAINSRTSTLTLGAEVGVDLTQDISASILRILDSRESTRFNLRYRLSDTVQLRGSTDFDEDHRGEVELQFRF